jgi:hypothetical protein
MSAGGSRAIPMIYPQLGNPLARTAFRAGDRPKYELR